MKRLTYRLNKKEEEDMSSKYLHYKYCRVPDYDLDRGNPSKITNDMLYNKLGKLEDLEEKLGCPLDIIFDALYRGIVCTPHPFYTHEIIYPKKEYNIVQLFQFYYLKVDDGVVDIKDYGKTWWLKEDKEE